MADLNEIKSLLEVQGSTWNEYKKANDERIARVEAGLSTSDQDAKLAAMEERMGAIDEIKSKLIAVEKNVARGNLAVDQKAGDLETETKSFNQARRAVVRPGAVVADISHDEMKAYKNAWEKQVRFGKESLDSDEVKALQAGVDPDGGYLLPPAAQGRIVTKVYEQSVFRSLAASMSISANDVEGLEDIGEAGAGAWMSETTAPSETTTPQVGKWRIEAHEYYVEPRITQRLLEDAAVNVESWLGMKIADKMSRIEGDAFLNGTGVGQPRGLFTYTTAATADASRTWGTFEHVASGASGALKAAASDPFDPFIDLTMAMKPVYLAGAVWYTRREMVAAMRKIKASDYQYLWQPSLQAGVPDRFMGYPVIVDQYVPAMGAGSLSLAFGDFSTAYLIVDRLGMTTLRDVYTAKPFIKFYTRRRVGGGATHYESVKFLKLS